MLTQYFKADALDYQKILDELHQQAEELTPMIADVGMRLDMLHREGENILFEGHKALGWILIMVPILLLRLLIQLQVVHQLEPALVQQTFITY